MAGLYDYGPPRRAVQRRDLDAVADHGPSGRPSPVLTRTRGLNGEARPRSSV